MKYPKAKWRPVSGLENDPPIIPVGCILHVSGGLGDSLFDYFNGPSKGVESHFYLNNKLQWEQYRDTTNEADANWAGNSWVTNGKRYGFISVETEGLVNGTWSPEVISELKQFLLWLKTNHKIPFRVAPTYRSSGIGYHIMFGYGDNAWTPGPKACPGPNRIKQFKEIIVPWLANPVNPTTPPVSEEEMNPVKNPVTGKLWPVEQALWSIWTYTIEARNNALRSVALGEANSKAITEVAKKTGLDSAAITKLIDDSVSAALSDKAWVLSVSSATVGATEPTPPTTP